VIYEWIAFAGGMSALICCVDNFQNDKVAKSLVLAALGFFLLFVPGEPATEIAVAWVEGFFT